jgi:hypothetical protein
VDAVKVAEEDPGPIVMDGGTVAAAFELDKPTAAPPAGADPDNTTVQVLEMPPWTVEGLQLSEDKLGPANGPDTVIVPPVPATVSPPPAAPTPKRLLKAIDAVDATLVKVIDATTPLKMIVEFTPVAKHVYDPEPPAQDSTFPAAEAEAPAMALTDATADGGYPMVHSKPAGSWPAGEAIERLSVTLAPDAATAEESVRLSDWPKTEPHKTRPTAIENRIFCTEGAILACPISWG